ncbi:30S ribosomal protein S13 [candidate division WWE3 bacterium CG10_big_fil_rev_8_21_14_0_10_32_10]|uniref:Small ribosomal subunit protein uS13 n=1 Tax=candidate division WWE3 bacterium CG10_big_fil_rev_8_21_14_0_10_32_10 TaxID=1975090 RepID=A0A2H0RB42_UNCKA|nr:MAG: 30S ribosomal protein S13 [candidate division WWE3 bacterium CG10_big_fil_rev_8_21_14_0_10_32_10]
MPRIMGVDVPNNKKIYISLTYIYGIGLTTAKRVLNRAKVDLDKKADVLSNEEVTRIREAIQSLGIRTEGELRRLISSNIKRLQDIRSYRGIRHRKGLPVRGQRTRTNSRTRKGKSRPVGGLKRVLTKT